MNRLDKVLTAIRPGMRIIELGPSYSPVVEKGRGWDLWTVDHASREALIAKYESTEHVDTSRIADVDVVWVDGPLHDAFPPETLGSFDAVIASHVLEHIPDPIGLFRSCEQLLAPDGVVSLVLPDKRYCFDFFKSLSTTAQLLGAHRRKAVRHSLEDRFEDVAYSVVSGGDIAWVDRPAEELEFFSSLDEAGRIFRTAETDPPDPYVDCHAWRFTPSSFELALLELAALEQIDFRLDRAFATDGHEFYVTLRRGRDPRTGADLLDNARMRLLRQVMQEVGVQAASIEPLRPMTGQRTTSGGIGDAEATLEEVLASTWWRLGRPLRGAVTAVRAPRSRIARAIQRFAPQRARRALRRNHPRP